MTSKFNQPLNKWNVSKVTNMKNMFKNAVSFNQPLDNWNVSNVEAVDSMFENASSFSQDLSTWHFKKIASEPINFLIGSSVDPNNRPEFGRRFNLENQELPIEISEILEPTGIFTTNVLFHEEHILTEGAKLEAKQTYFGTDATRELDVDRIRVVHNIQNNTMYYYFDQLRQVGDRRVYDETIVLISNSAGGDEFYRSISSSSTGSYQSDLNPEIFPGAELIPSVWAFYNPVLLNDSFVFNYLEMELDTSKPNGFLIETGMSTFITPFGVNSNFSVFDNIIEEFKAISDVEGTRLTFGDGTSVPYFNVNSNVEFGGRNYTFETVEDSETFDSFLKIEDKDGDFFLSFYPVGTHSIYIDRNIENYFYNLETYLSESNGLPFELRSLFEDSELFTGSISNMPDFNEIRFDFDFPITLKYTAIGLGTSHNSTGTSFTATFDKINKITYVQGFGGGGFILTEKVSEEGSLWVSGVSFPNDENLFLTPNITNFSNFEIKSNEEINFSKADISGTIDGISSSYLGKIFGGFNRLINIFDFDVKTYVSGNVVSSDGNTVTSISAVLKTQPTFDTISFELFDNTLSSIGSFTGEDLDSDGFFVLVGFPSNTFYINFDKAIE